MLFVIIFREFTKNMVEIIKAIIFQRKNIKVWHSKYEEKLFQFRFAFVDYSPMSGGCHFTNGCEKYQTRCGECPAFNSHNPKDFTYRNVLYRAKVYDKIQPVIT